MNLSPNRHWKTNSFKYDERNIKNWFKKNPQVVNMLKRQLLHVSLIRSTLKIFLLIISEFHVMGFSRIYPQLLTHTQLHVLSSVSSELSSIGSPQIKGGLKIK